MLKPQDVVFLLKLVAKDHLPWTYNELAAELGMSQSEVHYAAKRSVDSRLATKVGKEVRVNAQNLQEFLSHGIQYCFYPERGSLSRGMPTAHSAAPLNSLFAVNEDPPPVWPDSSGEVRGESFAPLHKAVPIAVKKDSKLYEMLALVDAIRGGRSREKEAARKEIRKRLEAYEQAHES
jgi:DNA-binding Lrp family transcriptional regulator